MSRWNDERWTQTGANEAGDPIYSRTAGSAVAEEDLESMSKQELQDLAESRGLPVSGTKAELIEYFTELTQTEVREYLRRYEEAGVDQVIFVMQAGRNQHEHIMESIELFGREVLPEFAEREIALDGIPGNGANRRHQGKGNRQVVMAAFLGQIGRSEIHGDALRGQAQA